MTVKELRERLTVGTKLTRLANMCRHRTVTKAHDHGFECEGRNSNVTVFTPWPKSDAHLIETPNGFTIDRTTFPDAVYLWGWVDPEGQAIP